MSELEALREENKRLRRDLQAYKDAGKKADLALREGLLLIVRSIEQRHGLGKYAETAREV